MRELSKATDLRPVRILHLASSYPDPIGPDTCASSLLLEEATQFSHQVFSFKRGNWRGGIKSIPFCDPAGQQHVATAYGAPAKGLYLKRNLDRLADHFLDLLDQGDMRPDILHGHKLTMDGYLAHALARRLNVPFAVTVQGNTDSKIIAMRPDLRAGFRKVWTEAAAVFSFAPVSATAMTETLGTRRGLLVELPCPTRADSIQSPSTIVPDGSKVVITAFNLDHYENKNVETLIRAIAIAARDVPGLRLDVIGGGSPRSVLAVADLAERHAPGRVRMLGAHSQAELVAEINAASAFALLSRRESFGMVFAEALLAGTPILYPRGRAVDGYFPNAGFAQSADPLDPNDIAERLKHLCIHEAGTKSALAQAQRNGDLNFLQRGSIAALYQSTMRDIL